MALDLDSVTWVLSGDEHVAEYVPPPNVVSSASEDLNAMLLSGEINPGCLTGDIFQLLRSDLAPVDSLGFFSSQNYSAIQGIEAGGGHSSIVIAVGGSFYG